MLCKFFIAASKIRAMQIRAMRNRASRGMTVPMHSLEIGSIYLSKKQRKTILWFPLESYNNFMNYIYISKISRNLTLPLDGANNNFYFQSKFLPSHIILVSYFITKSY